MHDESPTKRPSGSELAPRELTQEVRRIFLRDGGAAASSRTGVSRTAVERLAGSLPCRRGTILLAARNLGIDLGVDDEVADD